MWKYLIWVTQIKYILIELDSLVLIFIIDIQKQCAFGAQKFISAILSK